MHLKVLVIVGLVIGCFGMSTQKARAAYSLEGSTVATGSATVAMPITDLQISGDGDEPIPVKLYTTSGTLSMSTTTGLTFDGSSSGSEIYFITYKL